MDCLIVLTFGKMVHYGFAEPVSSYSRGRLVGWAASSGNAALIATFSYLF